MPLNTRPFDPEDDAADRLDLAALVDDLDGRPLRAVPAYDPETFGAGSDREARSTSGNPDDQWVSFDPPWLY